MWKAHRSIEDRSSESLSEPDGLLTSIDARVYIPCSLFLRRAAVPTKVAGLSSRTTALAAMVNTADCLF